MLRANSHNHQEPQEVDQKKEDESVTQAIYEVPYVVGGTGNAHGFPYQDLRHVSFWIAKHIDTKSTTY